MKMRYLTLLVPSFAVAYVHNMPVATANNPVTGHKDFNKQTQEHHKQVVQQILPPSRQDHNQQAMNPADLGPAIPGSPRQPSDKDDSGNGQLTISDILPSQRSINIFAGLTRNIESLSSRLESSLPDANTTLLAPLNSAMQSLPRKPWEDRPDDNSGVSATSSEDKAAQNLRRFVLEHVIPVSPWKEGKENAIKTLWTQQEGGEREIWWEQRKGGEDGQQEKKVIMPGEVVVEKVVGRVGNGEIWSLKGVVNYE